MSMAERGRCGCGCGARIELAHTFDTTHPGATRIGRRYLRDALYDLALYLGRHGRIDDALAILDASRRAGIGGVS